MSGTEVFYLTTNIAFPIMAQTFLYALYCVLTSYFVYQRWRTRDTAPLSAFIVWATLAMFALFTLYWSTNIYMLWARAYIDLQLDNDGVYTDAELQSARAVAEVLSQLAFFGQECVFPLILIIGDTISLWRAYVILGRRRWLFISTVGITVVEIALWSTIVAIVRVDKPELSGWPLYILQAVGLSVAALAQLFSTVLIASRTWAHWKSVRDFVHVSNIRQSIAMLLIIDETGIVYLCIFLCYALVNLLQLEEHTASAEIAARMLVECVLPLIAMYPTLVVVLVARRRPILECSINSTSRTILDARDDVHPEDREGQLELEQPGPRWVDVSFGSPFDLGNVAVAEKENDEEVLEMKPSYTQATADRMELLQERSCTPSSLSTTVVASSEIHAAAI